MDEKEGVVVPKAMSETMTVTRVQEVGSPQRVVASLTNDIRSLFVTAPTTPVAQAKSGGAATGCAVSGVTPTVFVVGGIAGDVQRLKQAMNLLRPAVAAASAAGNRIHFVFVGGTGGNLSVVRKLLALASSGAGGEARPEDVHFVVGPEEIGLLSALAAGAADAPTVRDFLRRSEYIGLYGQQYIGMWVKHASVSHAPKKKDTRTLSAWRDSVNAEWQAVVKSCSPAMTAEQRAELAHWLAQAAADAADVSGLPADGLGIDGSDAHAVFARPTGLPFGFGTRTLQKSGSSFFPGSAWTELGATSPSLFAAASTWCYSTTKAWRKLQKLDLNRSVTLPSLQYDVSCTLGSLVEHSEQSDALAQRSFPWRQLSAMRGRLGPCVTRAGRGGEEVLRAVHWTLKGAPDVLMLLPELWVQTVLSDYFQATVGLERAAGRMVLGVLSVPQQGLIAMQRPDVSAAEQLDTEQTLGSRIWKLDNASGAQDTFETHMSASDPLSGLVVQWVFAPGDAADMPTLDVVLVQT